MNNNKILVDCSFIAYLLFYRDKTLTEDNLASAILGDFMKVVLELGQKFETNAFYFCFDDKGSYRKELYPGYKDRDTTEDRAKERKLVHQTLQLMPEFLTNMGFRNCVKLDRLEGDDLIAKLCQQDQLSNIIMIVNDHDLCQMLAGNVIRHNPFTNKTDTYESFTTEFGITPDRYWEVMRLAGCVTDKVAGIKGIGEGTAFKYVAGEKISKARLQKIEEADPEEVALWELLTRLPFRGTPDIPVYENKFSYKGFMAECNRYLLDEHIENYEDERGELCLFKQWIKFFQGKFDTVTKIVKPVAVKTVISKQLKVHKRK